MSSEQQRESDLPEEEPITLQPTPPSASRTSPPSAPVRGCLSRLMLPCILIAAAAGGFYSAFRLLPDDSPIADAPPLEVQSDPPPVTLDELPTPAPQDRVPLDPLVPDSGEKLLAEAERVAEHLVERFPHQADAHEMLARLHYDFGDVERAEAAWKRCLELNPNYAYAHAGLAKLAVRRGAHDQAVAHYRRAVLAAPAVLAYQLELGKTLLAAGVVEEALDVLQRVARSDPSHVEAQASLGSARLQNQENEAAKTAFEAALALDPDYAAARFGLVTACARLGLEDEARQHEAKLRSARAERTDELRGQRVAYDDVRLLGVDMARLYSDMAGVYLTGGRPGAAERLWQRAARMNLENREARQGLAYLYLQQGNRTATIRMLRELGQFEPQSVNYPAEMARLYCEMGRLDEAEKVLRDFVQRAPDNAAGHAALSELYLEFMNQPERALEPAREAARLSGAAHDWVVLSSVHELTGDLPAAVAALEEASRRAPDDLQLRQLLALLKERAAATPPPAAAKTDNGPQKSFTPRMD
jgi:tetratricopeptide (TPR) repeat protein